MYKTRVMHGYKMDVGADHRLNALAGTPLFMDPDSVSKNTVMDICFGLEARSRTVLCRSETTVLAMKNWKFDGSRMLVGEVENTDATGSNETSSTEATSWKRIFGKKGVFVSARKTRGIPTVLHLKARHRDWEKMSGQQHAHDQRTSSNTSL